MEREALKLALEALGKAKRQIVHAKVAPHECIGDAITAIKKALAQPAQEPVAWMHVQGDYEEPSWRQLDDDEIEMGWKQYPLYTTPPQRKPLTQDGTMEIANQTAGQYWMDEAHIQRFRAAVEAAHGIKENT